ncbi:MAG: F0F1 ATP synthase subunit B [Anaerolineae bacterium]|jgi:F-type H+-transporting ATPase subunit b|nr:F0F1 ATP synthase subunit B [Chloroflexota bacterium]
MAELGLDLRLLLSQLVNFTLLILVLYWLLHKPLMAALDARTKREQETLDNNAESNRLLADMEQRHKDSVEQARNEAHDIVEQASRTAEQQRQEILVAARDEAQQIISRAQQEAQHERELAEIALRQEIVDLSIAAASRVIGQGLDDATHRRLVEEFLDQVSSS